MGNLLEAAEKGNSKLVKKYLREGGDIQQRDMFGSTPLHKASYEGHVEIVSTLLSEGANPNTQDKKGATPLHHASRKGYSNVALVLIRGGANVNSQRNDGETPLHRACYYGNSDVATLLIREGANLNIPNNDGETPLHKAVTRHENHSETVSIMINGGANLNAQNKDDETPLHRACSKEDTEFVRMLVRAGADIDIQNADKRSPVDIARHKMHPRGAELLEVFVTELNTIKKSQAITIMTLQGEYNALIQTHLQAKVALEQVAEDVGLDAPLFQELQLLRRSINIHLKYYDKKGLTEEIKRTTDRDTLRSLGERLRAIPFNEKDFEESLPEEAIKQRAIELLKKFEARWGTLLTKSDAESYERCRLARDDFDHLFREWCQKQSDQLVRRLEELISHWKDLNMETKGPTSTDGTPNTSTVTNFEDAFNEMTKLLPEEIKGHYNEVLEKMKQEIPLAVSE